MTEDREGTPQGQELDEPIRRAEDEDDQERLAALERVHRDLESELEEATDQAGPPRH